MSRHRSRSNDEYVFEPPFLPDLSVFESRELKAQIGFVHFSTKAPSHKRRTTKSRTRRPVSSTK